MTTEPFAPLDRLYTVAEVAEHLKVSSKTVLRLLEAGELSGHKLGRQWRISERDLKRYLNQHWRG